VQRQLQAGFSTEHLPSIVENGPEEGAEDDTIRSDTDDETVYTH